MSIENQTSEPRNKWQQQAIDEKQADEKIDAVGPWMIAWRKFRANRVAMAGLIIFGLIVLLVIFVPIIMGIDVNHYDTSI